MIENKSDNFTLVFIYEYLLNICFVIKNFYKKSFNSIDK